MALPKKQNKKSLITAQAVEQAFAFHRQGHLGEAEHFYQAVLEADGRHFDALHMLGVLRTQQGRYDEAIGLIGRALRRNPANSTAHANLGNALCAGGRHEEAIKCYRSALAINPADALTHNNLASVLRRLKRYELALASFRAVVELKQDDAEAHRNLGNLLSLLDRTEEAVANYQRAVAIKPADAEAHDSLAIALGVIERHEEAMAGFRRALAIDPGYYAAHCNQALVLNKLGCHEQAIAACQRAVAIRPDCAEAHWNQSLSLLALGDYGRGWQEYEWRWRVKELSAELNFPQPKWLGTQSLTGKTVLLHAEQGLGDTLQFVRYAPLVAAGGARVIVACQPPLKKLVARIDGVAKVVGIGETWPEFDLHCPLMSLPLAFKTEVSTIPATIPYLHADPAAAERWSGLVGNGSERKVGLVWAGEARNERPNARGFDRRRSVTLARLAPLADCGGVRFFSLQTGEPASQARHPPHGLALTDLSGELRDFSDTAALVSQLDLVITVDTSVAHLAGGMGKPVWILSRFDGCWRWLQDREDSPWYPTARLFRQPRSGDWDSVIEQLRKELLRFSHGAGC